MPTHLVPWAKPKIEPKRQLSLAVTSCVSSEAFATSGANVPGAATKMVPRPTFSLSNLLKRYSTPRLQLGLNANSKLDPKDMG
jgi:hypothetical protein